MAAQINPAIIAQVTELRRYLHQHPELSLQEFETQQYLQVYLDALQPDALHAVGGTGLLACFEGKEPGPTVLLRADIDALPITEVNQMAYRSQREGISHKCGHDGHTAIMAGVAAAFAERRPRKGKALLLFQPAEEVGKGAQLVLDDPAFAKYTPDFAFALHNLPGHALHEVVVSAPNFSAAVRSMIIQLQGKTAHAAEPENGQNPAYALSRLIAEMRVLEVADIRREDFALITPVYMELGEKAYGVAAGAGELHLTLRSWTNARMEQLCTAAEALVHAAIAADGLKASISYTESFYANENDARASEAVYAATQQLGLSLVEQPEPMRWGEDFGLFTQRIPGAMFGLGAGLDLPALHNPDYDFPDALLPTGISLFVTLVDEVADYV